MILFFEIPDEVEERTRRGFEELKSLAMDLPFETLTLPKGENFLQTMSSQTHQWYEVIEGSVALMKGRDRVMIYEKGDWFSRSFLGLGPQWSLINSDQRVELNGYNVSFNLSFETALFLEAVGLEFGEAYKPPLFVTFESGEVLLREGTSGSEIFALNEGSVSISVKGNQVGTLSAPDIFGMVAAFSGGPRSATVTALTDGSLFCVERDRFDLLLKTHPQTLQQFMDTISRILASMNSQMLEFSSRSSLSNRQQSE